MFKKIKSDLLAGIATALFSIPGGMAYAKLAGVNPLYGIYSGIVATIVASFATGTVLMLSTLTSSIAIATRSVFSVVQIPHDQFETALFTLTFMMGCIMLILGVFRLGKIVDFVSSAVMTGFIVGASSLILIGELGDLVGYQVTGENSLKEIVDWAAHIQEWDLVTAVIGFGSIFAMLLLQRIPLLSIASSVIVLVGGTVLVYLLHLPVKQVKDIVAITGDLPSLTLPDVALMPKLLLGAFSVAIVALIQGAGVSTAIKNPRGKRTDYSQDFIAEGLGNLFGGLFQSMGTGGSLSRTAVSVSAGAKTRFAGVFAGGWLILAVSLGGYLIQFVPLTVISGVLIVVAIELIQKQIPDIRLILNTSREPAFVMLLTFGSALFIPLQWTIFLGAGLSFLYYVYSSSKNIHLVELVKNREGYFEEHSLPKKIPSNKVTILDFEGNMFFAQVPVVEKLMPSIEKTEKAVLIWRVRGLEDIHSTFLKYLGHFAEEFHQKGNRFIIEGVEPHVMEKLKKTKLLQVIGKKNVVPAGKALLETLDKLQYQVKWNESSK